MDVTTCKVDGRFIAFSECSTGVSGQAIADPLLGLQKSWQLPASNMIGQAYDGAGSMAGKHRGAASIQNLEMLTHSLEIKIWLLDEKDLKISHFES